MTPDPFVAIEEIMALMASGNSPAWEIAMRAAMTQGWLALGWFIAAVAGSAFLAARGLRLLNSACPGHDCPREWRGWTLAVLAAGVFAIGLFKLNEASRILSAPEWAAMEIMLVAHGRANPEQAVSRW